MPESPRTLSEKVWDRHVVHAGVGEEPDIIFIDLHLIHEVTSPQAFEGLRLAGRGVHRPDLTIATADHNVPTTDIDKPVADPISAKQLAVLGTNCNEFGITCYPMGDANQGIVHIIGPEQGLTQPGMTIVCGDSHTSTHGAFGALAFGIGTSEVEHVLATQTLPQKRPATMAVTIDGELPPDDTAFPSLEGRDHAPKGAAWEEALADWRTLPTDAGAGFDKEVVLEAASLAPFVTWGTNPAQVARIDGTVPEPSSFEDPVDRETAARALEYMGLAGGTPIRDIAVDTVFIGSCTNGRIEDLRAAAGVLEGRTVRPGMRALVVPGSHRVKAQAEAEGLDAVFTAAGFDWREPGCSMCLAMNPDKLSPGERAASTSNRNFEGRQGRGGRTHLVSPAVAASTAVAGRFATPEELS